MATIDGKMSIDAVPNSIVQDVGDTTTTLQEHFLLEALQGFILPHIGAAVGSDCHTEMAQKLAGPQAKKFITALKEFISSLVGTSTRTKVETTIKVALEKDNSAEENSNRNLPRASNSSGRQSSREFFQQQTHTRVLHELHHQVFNQMPIRLLRFVQKGPILEISLIERAAIYEHLVSLLETSKDEKGRYIYNETLRKYGDEIDDEKICRIVAKHARYAILSHTWLRQSPEVTYGAWKAGSFDSRSPGYSKLINFGRVACSMHGLTLGWMDTLCINKESSSELDESIRSMYKWYKIAGVCIVHLADSESLYDMDNDSWFTRGWTLQELLAPSVLKFYNRSWQQIVDSENDKQDDSVVIKIYEATSIIPDELADIQFHSISRKMQLAAPRIVTREEDMAYSLMGLFDVSIATAYGEGAGRAFNRLLEEIINTNSSHVLDLFNWSGAGNSSVSTILPMSPKQYLEGWGDIPYAGKPIQPLRLTQMGLHIPLLLMHGTSFQGITSHDPVGDYSALVGISTLKPHQHLPQTYNLLQRRRLHRDSDPRCYDSRAKFQFTFAVLNISRKGQFIEIPHICIAIPLACHEDSGKITSYGQFTRIYTTEPVVFVMLERNPKQDNKSEVDYMRATIMPTSILQEDLDNHGMQLVFKCL